MHRLLGKIPCGQAWCVDYLPCKKTTAQLYIARMGTQVIVPYRDEDEVRRLKLMGDLGKIVKMVILLLLERGVLVV